MLVSMKAVPPTKTKILEISIDLFAKNGFAETSIRDIAREAGIKSSSLYYHFQSKEEILYEILDMSRKVFISVRNWEAFQEELNTRTSMVQPQDIVGLLFYKFDEEDAVMGMNMLKIIYMEASRNETVRDFFTQEYLVQVYRNIVDVLTYLRENGYVNLEDVRMTSSTLFSLAISFITLGFYNISQMDPEDENTNMFTMMEYVIDLVMKQSIQGQVE